MRDVDDVENGGWERRSILVRHRPPVGLLFSRFSLAFKPGLHCLGRLARSGFPASRAWLVGVYSTRVVADETGPGKRLARPCPGFNTT